MALNRQNGHGHASACLVDCNEFSPGVFHHPVYGVANKHPIFVCTINGYAVLGPIPCVFSGRLYVGKLLPCKPSCGS